MYSTKEGIPGLPDLTHPTELIQLGSQLLPGLILLVVLIIALGVAIAASLFFACLLSLTYLSRFMNAELAWTMISLILLTLSWGLGSSGSTALAVIICTIAGAILPVFGLLVPFSGLTLSVAGLLSAIWLAVRHWYKWYLLQPEDNF